MSKILIIFCFCFSLVRGQDTSIVFLSDDIYKLTVKDSSMSLIEEFYFIDSIEYMIGDYFLAYKERDDFICRIGHYDKGKKDGVWTTKKNDTLLFSTEYKKGLKHGKDLSYFNGKKVKSISYKAGLRKGQSIFYFKDGIEIKGKYSSDYIDFEFSTDSVLISFSNEKRIIIELNNQSKLDSIYQRYFVMNPSKRSWLKTGVWKVIKDDKTIVKLKFNNDGVLEREEVLNDIDYVSYFISKNI